MRKKRVQKEELRISWKKKSKMKMRSKYEQIM